VAEFHFPEYQGGIAKSYREISDESRVISRESAWRARMRIAFGYLAAPMEVLAVSMFPEHLQAL
jgi:hypothetical protein